MRLTWRFWVVVGVLAAAWIVAGMSAAFQAQADVWVYRIGLSGTAVIAAGFVVAWTLHGLLRPGAPRWWKTDLGASLMILTASFLPGYGALAWVFDFGNGQLHEGMLGWTALAGPVVSLFAVTWCAVLWMLTIERKRGKANDHSDAAASQAGDIK